jgi:hypothetical protein
MLKLSFKNITLFFSIMFSFLLSYPNQVSASWVDASKYGFNATDATLALKTAIAQRKDTVIVPNMGSDWIVTPIFCTVPNQTIIFEKGVVVTAKKGGAFGCLFSIEKVANVSLIGYGATFKMQKADYMAADPTGLNQWRHCIGIEAATGIKILGLYLKDSGGDGVAIMYNSENILIKDVICDNNYRNGMSPISSKNFTIENCVMINTWGHPGGPCVGVDFEPNVPGDLMVNGKMINCYVDNNRSGGISLFFRPLTSSSVPVDLQIKHCFVSTRSGNPGIVLSPIAPGLKGTVSFEDCITENPSGIYGGLCCWGKSANAYLAKFTNCLWQYCNNAITFIDNYAPVIGNLQFVNSTINEPDQQLTIERDFSRGTFGIANVSGNLKINSPYGLQSASLGTGSNVTLALTEQKSKPPMVTAVKPDKGNPSNSVPAKIPEYTAGSPINISAVAYDPDNGTANGAGIKKVDFAIWRGDGAVASYSDVSAPYEWPVTATKTYGGIYLIRITAYSGDGSYTVACVPVYIYNPAGPGGTGLPGTGIELNHEVWNDLSGKEFLVRNTSEGFLVYSPFSTDSRIVISDLSGRQVTLNKAAKGKSWNNIGAQNKLLSGVYFIQVTDSKGNNSIVKKAITVR